MTSSIHRLRSARIAALLSFSAVLLLAASNARAAVLSTIEATLQANNLGPQYEIAFVTSGVTTATDSIIGDYNTYVTNQAALSSPYLSDFVPPDTSWKAIISTQSVATTTNAPDPPTYQSSTLRATR